MSDRIDTTVENIKNTFAPNLENEYFSIDGIIHCLKHGFMRMSKLPPEIVLQVHEELVRLKSMNQ